MFADIVRGLFLVLALILIGLGVVMSALHASGLGLVVSGVMLLAGVVFERWRYKAVTSRPAPGLQPTSERFFDPTTRTPIRVYLDPATGERRYVEDRDP